MAYESKSAQQQTDKSRRNDWIIFGVALVIMLFFLVVDPTWFWLPLPFVLTFFVRGIGYM